MIEPVNEVQLSVGQEYVVTYPPYVKEKWIYLGDTYFRSSRTMLVLQLKQNFFHFYRSVSKEEYYNKLKQKYDATCLNLILKRLVNESFGW